MWLCPAVWPSVALGTARTEPVGPAGQAVIILACIGIGGVIALVGLGYLQMYSRVRKTDPTVIAQVTRTDTEVELTGTARPHESVSTSPFTETACLAHDWAVTEDRNSGGSGSSRVTLDAGEVREPFVLEDETGTALVMPASATLELTDEETITVDPAESPPPAISQYLAEADDIDPEHGRERKYTEQRLRVGAEIHVLGPVQAVSQSTELPGDVDALIGVDNPDRGFTVGEDGLSDLVEQIKADTVQFVITIGGERQAERHLLKKGLAIAAFGVLFALIPLVIVVAL
jgi:hypothetical protein